MIDWDRARELRDEVGEDAFEEVVELFLEEVDEVVLRLKTSPDPTRFAEEFHFLKGSALNLGFAAFAERCRLGEMAAASGADVDLAGILSCYATSRDTFMAELATGLAA